MEGGGEGGREGVCMNHWAEPCGMIGVATWHTKTRGQARRVLARELQPINTTALGWDKDPVGQIST